MQLKSIIYTLVQSYGYIIIYIYMHTLTPRTINAVFKNNLSENPKNPTPPISRTGHSWTFCDQWQVPHVQPIFPTTVLAEFPTTVLQLEKRICLCHTPKIRGKKTGKNRVSSWWFFPTHLKNISQIGNHPQFSG